MSYFTLLSLYFPFSANISNKTYYTRKITEHQNFQFFHTGARLRSNITHSFSAKDMYLIFSKAGPGPATTSTVLAIAGFAIAHSSE